MRRPTCALLLPLLLCVLTLCYAAVLDRPGAESGCPAGARCAPLSQCPSAALDELRGRSCGAAARELSVCCSEEPSPAALSAPFQRHRRSPSAPSTPSTPSTTSTTSTTSTSSATSTTSTTSSPSSSSTSAATTAKAPGTRPPAKTTPKPTATPAPAPSVTSAPPTPPQTTPSGNGKPRSASPSQRACEEFRHYEYPLGLVRRKRMVLQQLNVVGGERARNAEFSYMVAIGYRRVNSVSNTTAILWGCGGSLISDRYVLTAAHCITDPQRQNLRPVALRLGENHLSEGPQRPGDHSVESITLHPRYRPELKYFDLALLRTNRPVSLSPSVTPVCLATPETRVTANANTTLLVAGWGAIDPAGFEPSADLKKARLRFIELEECKNNFMKSDNLPRGLDNSMLCAAEPNREADTCKGDSGGPLVVREPQGDVLVGVTSFGGRPCAGSKPGVYARVQPELSWIESVVWR